MDPELKKLLLGVAEKHLNAAIDDVELIAKYLAAKSENTIDDIAVSLIAPFKEELKKMVDKLDGEVG